MQTHEIFAKKQALTVYTVEELCQMVQFDQLILRETSVPHVRKIRKYITDNFLANAVYFPPIVAMVSASQSLSDGKPTSLIVIDGSNRLKAVTEFEGTIFKLIQSDDEQSQRCGFMLKYRLKDMKIAVQVFEGLTESEAAQLYVDLNSKGKKVALSKRIANDSRNVINVATNYILSQHQQLKQAGIETERASLIRPKNKNFLSLSQLRSVVMLFIGDYSKLTTFDEQEMTPIFQRLHTWFDQLFELQSPENIGNYHNSILASFPVVYALAEYACWNIEEVKVDEQIAYIQGRMELLKQLNWGRNQKIWQQFNGSYKGKEGYYYIDNNKKTIQTIVEWLVKEVKQM